MAAPIHCPVRNARPKAIGQPYVSYCFKLKINVREY
jgi:hypothetical protein